MGHEDAEPRQRRPVRHAKKACYVYADGHAGVLDWKEAAQAICDPSKRFFNFD